MQMSAGKLTSAISWRFAAERARKLPTGRSGLICSCQIRAHVAAEKEGAHGSRLVRSHVAVEDRAHVAARSGRM